MSDLNWEHWAICCHGFHAKKCSNLLQNLPPNSVWKPKPPAWYAATPTCTEMVPRSNSPCVWWVMKGWAKVQGAGAPMRYCTHIASESTGKQERSGQGYPGNHGTWVPAAADRVNAQSAEESVNVWVDRGEGRASSSSSIRGSSPAHWDEPQEGGGSWCYQPTCKPTEKVASCSKMPCCVTSDLPQELISYRMESLGRACPPKVSTCLGASLPQKPTSLNLPHIRGSRRCTGDVCRLSQVPSLRRFCHAPQTHLLHWISYPSSAEVRVSQLRGTCEHLVYTLFSQQKYFPWIICCCCTYAVLDCCISCLT